MLPEQNEREEAPGAFLSLSAQASSSPLRGPPAAESSPHVTAKQEQGDLETCLSLQQPSQKQSIEPLHQTPALVHAEEVRRRNYTKDQSAADLEKTLYEQKSVVLSEQSRRSFSEVLSEHQKHDLGASESEKASSSEFENHSSFHISSEQHKPASPEPQSLVSIQGPPEQQRPSATWLALVEQQRSPSCLGLLHQQKLSPLVGHLEHLKETGSFGLLAEQQKPSPSVGHLEHLIETGSFGLLAEQNPSSFHGIPEQQKPKFSLSVSPLSLQVSPKQEKHVGAVEEETPTSTELEMVPPLQPSLDHKPSFMHRPGVLSPQSEQENASALVQEHKKGLTDPSLDQQKLSLSNQWHKSAFMQAHVPHGPSDLLKGGSFPRLHDDQKSKFMQGYAVEQKAFVSERMPDQQVISHCQALRLQQGLASQAAAPVMQDTAGVFSPKPNMLPDRLDTAGVFSPNPNVPPDRVDQGALPKETESNLSMESPLACLVSPRGAEHIYPAPMATHEAVLADRRLFMKTLQSLHMALNLHVSVPKVQGIDLDLYKLYKEVTCRGGLEMVINNRRWQEVVHAFDFPPNATNASYILRRTYISTLHHYEQVYFFGTSGRIIPPPAAYTSQSPEREDGRGFYETEIGLRVPNGSSDSAQALGVDPAASVGAIVSGAIDGKFEDGYLVTVMVGARKLRGVLYHVASTDIPPQNALVPSLMQSVGSEIQSLDVAPKVGRKRKKREVFRKDPNAPRQNRTGYNFFFAEQRAKLKTMQPDKDRAISKMIGELWSKLSEDEKSPYQVKGVMDKERYVKEMKEYKEKIKLPMIGGSMELQTVPPPPSQLPYTYISQPLNDHKAVSPQLSFSYVPEGSNNSKGVLPQLPLAIVPEAKALQPQVHLTSISEALNVSKTTLSLMGVASMKTAEQVTETMTASSLTAVSDVAITAMAATVVSTPIVLSISDPSATSTVVDKSKFLVDEKSPKSLPQPGSQSLAGSDTRTETEEHVTKIEQ